MSDQMQSTGQTQNAQTKAPWYKKWWVIGIGILLLYSIGSNSLDDAQQKAKEATNNTGQQVAQQADQPKGQVQQTETIKEEPLNYEVIQKMPGGTTLVMRVYTTEKESEKLIKLTDKLFNENKKGLTHLTIEYFDDKELATSYFSKLSDDNISDTEKDKMFTHYIASLVYNTTSGYKALKMNQDNSWVELKKY